MDKSGSLWVTWVSYCEHGKNFRIPQIEVLIKKLSDLFSRKNMPLEEVGFIFKREVTSTKLSIL
jgi:hypothetical protein